MTVLERIKKISKKRGLSLTTVNELAHLGTNTIYSWNKKEPSFNNLEAVAKVLNVSTDYLQGKTDDDSLPNKETQNIDIKNVIDDDDDFYMTYQGKPLSDTDKELIKRIFEGKE